MIQDAISLHSLVDGQRSSAQGVGESPVLLGTLCCSIAEAKDMLRTQGQSISQFDEYGLQVDASPCLSNQDWSTIWLRRAAHSKISTVPLIGLRSSMSDLLFHDLCQAVEDNGSKVQEPVTVAIENGLADISRPDQPLAKLSQVARDLIRTLHEHSSIELNSPRWLVSMTEKPEQDSPSSMIL